MPVLSLSGIFFTILISVFTMFLHFRTYTFFSFGKDNITGMKGDLARVRFAGVERLDLSYNRINTILVQY